MKKIREKTAEELMAMTDEEIDFSDIPELDDRFMTRVDLFRPKPKQQISLRLDPDVMHWFKRQGAGYQGYINAVLKAFVETRKNPGA